MDDYILKVLLEQESTRKEGEAGAVQKKLEETVQSGAIPAEQLGENAARPAGEPEKIEKSRSRQTENMVLEGLRVAEKVAQWETMEAPGHLGEKSRGGASKGSAQDRSFTVEEMAPTVQKSQEKTWGSTGTPTQQRPLGMSPEKLSMFFQRDARRYS